MIYDVRLREIIIHEFQVDSEDLRSAFLVALRKAHSKKLKNQPVGRFFEIETLNKGMKNESINTKTLNQSAKHRKLSRKLTKV